MTSNSLFSSDILTKLVFILSSVAIISCSSPTGIKRIWAVDDGEKIRQDDMDHPLSSDKNNAVWSDNTVKIFGAGNEIVAFQLIIEADESGAEDVDIELSDLANGNSVIPGSASGPVDPFDYRGRYVEIFIEHYLNMVKRSPPLWFFSESAAPSAYYTGWVPDCLIPFSASPGKGGAPFNIASGKNQGVWVDIFIPADAVAGIYKGNITISVKNKVYDKIPVNLEVYDFNLPDSTHLKNMFGYYPRFIAERHNVTPGSEKYYDLEIKYHQLAHRHRFDLVTNVRNLDDMTKYYKRYHTGEIYTSEYGYFGPGYNTGNTTFSIGYGGSFPKEYGGSVNNMNRHDWYAGSDAWETWFLQNAPGVDRHKYLFPDEPDFKGPEGAKGTGSMDTIRMQATWTHENPGPGKNIPTFVTNKIIPGLKGHVDFWSVSSEEFTMNLTPEEVASERAQGKRFGIYNGYRPGMGAVVSDADAIEFRVMPWIVWKYDIDQYFYWSTTFWTDLDVFTNPLTYEDRINGDGTFLYPGQDILFPVQDRDLNGPLSSIRAKNWRRGAQDYEYIRLAKEMGFEKELEKIVNTCIPSAIWDAKSQDDVSWPSRGFEFEKYRRQLAELISKGETR